MIKKRAPLYVLLLLIFAGEAVFILPFVLARVFRPTVLETFQLDNIQLGLCFSVYGVVAMVSYLLGGPMADKYAPRKLIAIALWLTALGGVFYATFPSVPALQILYAYWGFTTIFLFWAPMIKATRLWGGSKAQAKAFGFLDGGRGLVGALFGSIGVLVFSLFIESDKGIVQEINAKDAFRMVILVSSALVAFIGLLVWLLMKEGSASDTALNTEQISMNQIREVIQLPSVWLLMIIILCAYVGYKVTDVFSLYTSDVMHYNSIDSAKVGTGLLYMRPIVGGIIGVLADRSQITRVLCLSFAVAIIGAVLFAAGIIVGSNTLLFIISTALVAAGVYGARSLYFAVMEQGRIPLNLTGTAVGLVSLIGYTPDVFAGPAIGYLLESSPGIAGHQHTFIMLAVFSFGGLVAGCFYHLKYRK